MKSEIILRQGLYTEQLPAAVAIYDEAFADKFSLAIPNLATRRAFLQSSLSPENCICAECNGELIGVLGFQLHGKSFTGGITGIGVSWKKLRLRLGILASIRALLIFALFARKSNEDTLLLDGIAVSKNYRGGGVGRSLLNEVLILAGRNACRSVRLDVIGTNPRAKSLYEKVGFRVQQVHSFPYLKCLLGFEQSYTMIYDLC